jgi:HPt (histidine-containing phosphotransfer) domain-containing protein
MTLDKKHTTMTDRLAAAPGDVRRGIEPNDPAFDAEEFDALSDMIGEDGVREMVEIFEAETRQRLRRLAAGDQNFAALVREMHTLKGAAATVAAPRLAVLGRAFEKAAQRGNAPTSDQLKAIGDALEAFLAQVRTRNETRAPSA